MLYTDPELTIIKSASKKIGNECYNINVLESFLKKNYPDNASIEEVIYILGLLRASSLEKSIPTVHIDKPVFGKELAMVDMNKFLKLLMLRQGSTKLLYIDSPNALNFKTYHRYVNDPTTGIEIHEVEF